MPTTMNDDASERTETMGRERGRRGRETMDRTPATLAVTAGTMTFAALALFATFVVNRQLFVDPPGHVPTSVDAIVVYAAGDGRRLPHALELLRAGVSRVLVLNPGVHGSPTMAPTRELCASGLPGYEIVCREARPDSTAGESRTFSDIAAERNLKSLLVVTSRTHLTRARLWLRRCHDGPVFGSPSDIDGTFRTYLHEWLGTADMTLLHRSCPAAPTDGASQTVRRTD